MTLLWWELRKILNPSIIVAVLLLGVVYYILFPEFYIQYFCNGENAKAEFALSAEWIEKYGVTMSVSERMELDLQLEKEFEEFRTGLLAIPEASEMGVRDYDSFNEYSNRYFDQIAAEGNMADMGQERFRWRVMDGTNFYRVQALESFIASYDRMAENDRAAVMRVQGGYTDAMIRRMDELMQSEQKYGFLPTCIYDSTREYSKDLAVWCVLSVVLLSPVLVRDRLCRTLPMQWSSCQGRHILQTQMTAACLVAFVVTVVNLAVYGIPFLRQNPLIFKDCGLESMWGSATPWFDWTYGVYLTALIGLILVLSMAAALLVVFLSQYSNNYIPMLLKALPLFVVSGPLLGNWMLDGSFYFRGLWQGAQMWGFCGMEVVVAVLLLILGASLCVSAAMRQRSVDITESI